LILGYRGNPDWRDMSEYVVHFTKDSDDASALENLQQILEDQDIRASGPFGWAKGLNALGDSQKVACFSEIPLDLLDRLVDRRSSYGLGFHQRTLLDAGGARVWYVDRHSQIGEVLDTRLMALVESRDWDDDLWSLTPFIDQPYDAPTGGYRFEWEREWRVPGGLQFDLDEVAFVFVPEEEHGFLRDYITQYLDRDQVALGPGLVDPLWDADSLQRAFLGLG